MTRKLLVLLAVWSAATFIASASQAQTLYWSGGTAAAGTWDSVTTLWSSASGGALNSAWVSGADANFATTGAALTVTVSGTQAVHNITFGGTVPASAGIYTFTSGMLQLVGDAPTINFSSLGTAAIVPSITINSGVSGTSGLIITGNGLVNMAGNKTYSGTTIIRQGVAIVSATSTSAFGTGDIVIEAGGCFLTGGSNGNYTVNNNVRFTGTGATLTGYGSGAIMVTGGGGRNTTFNGSVTGSSGQIWFAGGGTKIFNGAFSLTDSRFLVGSGGVTFNGTTTLNGNTTLSATASGAFTINGPLYLNGGEAGVRDRTYVSVINGVTYVTGSGTLTAAYLVDGWGSNLTVNNSIVGSGATLTLKYQPASTNTIQNTAWQLITGSVDLGTNGTLVKNYSGFASIAGTVADGRVSSWGTVRITEGTLQIGDSTANSGALSEAALAATYDIGYTTYAGGNYGGRLQFNTDRSYTLSGSITGSASDSINASSFVSGLYIAKVGTLTLSGSNSYGGATTLAGSGVLRLTNSDAIGVSSLVLSGGGTGTGYVALTNSIAATNNANLAGRSTTAAHLVNESGSNSLSGAVSLVAGGSNYTIQSDAGSLTLGSVTNNSADTANAFLNIGGAGNGSITGVIANGTATNVLGLTKSGAGTWTFGGVNTYYGNTVINGGTLALASTASIANSANVAVNTGATFDVSAISGFTLGASSTQVLQGAGTVKGAVTLGSYGSIYVGGAGTAGTLTVTNALDVSNGSLYFDLSNSTSGVNDVISAATVAFGTKTSKVNIGMLNGYLASGTYTLANYTSATGTVDNTCLYGTGTTRQTFSLVNLATKLNLTVSGSSFTEVWTGGSGVWDVKGATNWTNGGDNLYWDLDHVQFTDSASVTTVTLNTTVYPASVNFTNSTKDYTVSGAGKISGSASLTKTGTGKVIIANTGGNDFTGLVTINGGSLQLNDGATLGSAASLVDNATFIINNNADLTWGGTASGLNNKVITGSGSVVKTGVGTLSLAGSNAFGGNFTVAAGKTVLRQGYALGDLSRSGTISVASGATLDINTTYVTSLGSMVLSFAGAGVDGLGAITNSGTVPAYWCVNYAEMTGDATIGGDAARYDFGRTAGDYLHGNGHTLTKAGTSRILFVDVGETNLGAVVVDGGELCIQGSSVLGTSAAPANVTVNAGGALTFWSLSATAPTVLNNNVVVNGGKIGSVLHDSNTAGVFGGNITVVGSANLNAVGTGSLMTTATFTGTISGDSVYKTGAGTVVIAGAAKWTGVTSIGSGSLKFGNGGALDYSLTGPVSNETTNAVVFNTSNSITIENQFVKGTNSSVYGLTFAGSGVYRPTGANEYTGATTVTNNACLSLNELGMAQGLGVTSGLTIVGSANTAKLAFETTGSSLNTFYLGPDFMAPISLGGRQPTYLTAQIQNISGYNRIVSVINLTAGGDRYIFQSDSGTLSLGTITNLNSSTNRYVYLQGEGFGEVVGMITDGTNSPVNVIKTGAGTWSLNDINTYTGLTTVEAGKLVNAGKISGDIVVNANAVLGWSSSYAIGASGTQTVSGSGTIKAEASSVSFGDGSTGRAYVVPGGNSTIGTLTIDQNGGSLALTSGVVANFDVKGANADVLAVQGSISGLSDSYVNVNFIGRPTRSTYTIMTSTAGISSGVTSANISNNTRFSLSAAVSGNNLVLQVSGTNASLVWNGVSGVDVWDVRTSSSWLNGASSDMYYDIDDVVFNDVAPYKTVVLNTTVYPTSVTFSGTSSYTLTGTGKITGDSSLVKYGNGTLTISSTNDYTGDTVIYGGRIMYSTAGAATTYTSSRIVVKNGGMFNLNSSAVTTYGNRVISIEGTGWNGYGAIDTSSTTTRNGLVNRLEMTGDATISANFTRWDIGRTAGSYFHGNGYTLTKSGTGRLLLVDVGNTDLGAVIVSRGDLTIQGVTALGNSATGVYCTVTASAGGLFSYWGAGSVIHNNVVLVGGTVGCDDSAANSGINDAGNGTFAGNIDVVGSGTLYVSGAGNINAITYSGRLTSDAGETLRVSGSGTTILSGSQALNGSTNVASGVTLLGGSGSLGDVTVAAGAKLVLSSSGTHTISSIVSAASTVAVNGDAVITVGTLVADSLILGGTTAEENLTAASDVVAVSSVNSVPEPSTFALLGVAAAGLALGWIRRRK